MARWYVTWVMCIQAINGTSGLSYGDIWLLSTRNGKSCDHSLEHPCNLRKLWVVFSRYCCILSFVAFHVFLWIIKLNMLFYFPKYLQLFFLSNVPDYRNFLNQKAYDLMNFMHFLSVFFFVTAAPGTFPQLSTWHSILWQGSFNTWGERGNTKIWIYM